MHSINIDSNLYVDHQNYNCKFLNSPKSLSDSEDDDDDQKEYDYRSVQVAEQQDHDVKKRDDFELEAEAQRERESVPLQKKEESEKEEDDADLEGQDEDEDDLMEDDENLLLDKDKEIAKMLKKRGYRRLSKLCFTDQGSVWRAKYGKESELESVVIKIASKLHYVGKNKGDIPSEHEDILKEIELLQHINEEQKKCDSITVQKSIIEVIDTIENEENYMVVLEDGGMDLFNFCTKVHEEIAAQKVTVGEWQKTVRLIAKKLIELIHWLHSQNICHLDISLENVLISNIDWVSYPDQYKNYKKRLSPDFKLKLIDFGAAQCFKGNTGFDCKSIIGKPSYCSPQIYSLQNVAHKKMEEMKVFDARKADLWSYGVCLFVMSFGCYPWTEPDEHQNKLYQTIVLEKNLNFILTKWKRSNYVDENMKDLLSKIFVIDEKQRMSTNEIIKHSWLC